MVFLAGVAFIHPLSPHPAQLAKAIALPMRGWPQKIAALLPKGMQYQLGRHKENLQFYQLKVAKLKGNEQRKLATLLA